MNSPTGQKRQGVHGIQIKRRDGWRQLWLLTTGVLLLQWSAGALLAWRSNLGTLSFGVGAIVAAALLQSVLFGDRLFLAFEARRALSATKRTATVGGQVFADVRHLLSIRQRTRAGRWGLLLGLLVFAPALVAASVHLGVGMPWLMTLAIAALALGATPDLLRLSTACSGAALIFSTPRGTPLWTDVGLCLLGALGLAAASWRQAVLDDRCRFADAPHCPPVSRGGHGLKAALQLVLVGMLAAALLPKPKAWQAPTNRPNAATGEAQQGGGGVQPPRQKQKSERNTEEQDQKQKPQKSQQAGQGPGSGGGQGRGQGPARGDNQGRAAGGAPHAGPRSDGDAPTGERLINPEPQLPEPQDPLKKRLWWLLGVALVLVGVIALVTRRKQRRTPRQPTDREAQNRPLSRQEWLASQQVLGHALRTAQTLPQPDATTVIALYNSLLEHMARIGRPRQAGETPDEFAARWGVTAGKGGADQAAAADARLVTHVFCRAYYGRMDPKVDEFQRFFQATVRLGATSPHH